MTDKLALLIGINYTGLDNELNGCINDVKNMKNYLIKHCGFIESNIVLLTDETEKNPTALNIMRELGNIIELAYNKKANKIFIHYSGHGTYLYDTSGDELDNKDEALVPLDYKEMGMITDDLLNDYLSYLPSDCFCVCLFDCCHSGTILDLKYRYIEKQKNIIENKKNKLNSNIIMISGCKDQQTSADAFISGKWAGAMTTSFLDTMNKFDHNITCFHLLEEMRKYLLQKGYDQVPQICSSKPLNNTSLFMCKEPLPIPYITTN